MNRQPEPEPDNVAATAFITAEFAALRDEIGRYQDHQRQLFNTVFLLIGGAVTLATQSSSQEDSTVSPEVLLLCIPPLYALLTLLYLDRAVRIVRLAHYLHHHARPKASGLAGVCVWEWETYKNETKVVSRRIALVLDRLRWSIFIVPLAGTVVFTTFLLEDVDRNYRTGSAVVGSISLAFALGAAFLTEETTGVVKRAPDPVPNVDEGRAVS